MNSSDYILMAHKVFEEEIQGLQLLKDSMGDEFIQIVQILLECEGKVMITGMGKSGHIARKISATMSSLGISSFFLHPAEAQHGDLGMVTGKDVIIMISYSGESDEIIGLLPAIKIIGAKIIAITGAANSQLAKNSNIVQVLPEMEEADPLRLAPTSSTTAVLVYGDALAVTVSQAKGFTKERFALYHPAGLLGKKLLLKVADVMLKREESAFVYRDVMFKEAVAQMCLKSSRILSILDEDETLFGIITDGDIRRQIEANQLDNRKYAVDMCTRSPRIILKDELAVDALALMRQYNISALPVIDENYQFVGTLGFQELMRVGLCN